MGDIPYTDNVNNLERPQKTFAKLDLKEKYKDYESSLTLLNLDSLEKRRQDLCLKFAKNGIKNNKLNDLFPLNKKEHTMETRENLKYKVNFANTDRLKTSSIIAMQHMLNEEEKINKLV